MEAHTYQSSRVHLGLQPLLPHPAGFGVSPPHWLHSGFPHDETLSLGFADPLQVSIPLPNVLNANLSNVPVDIAEVRMASPMGAPTFQEALLPVWAPRKPHLGYGEKLAKVRMTKRNIFCAASPRQMTLSTRPLCRAPARGTPRPCLLAEVSPAPPPRSPHWPHLQFLLCNALCCHCALSGKSDWLVGRSWHWGRESCAAEGVEGSVATFNTYSQEAELFFIHKGYSCIALSIKSFSASVFLSLNIYLMGGSGSTVPL